MDFDYNSAESNTGDLIPKGTIAPVIMSIRPGSAGEGGWLTQSRSSDYQYLTCEFTVVAGPYAKRKFWGNFMAFHPEAENKAVNITRSTLRGILESARGIDPKDESEAAKAKRIVSGFGDFDGMEFVAKIGVQVDEQYGDKNQLDRPIPVTSKDYAAAKSGATPAASPNPTPASSNAPAWAS